MALKIRGFWLSIFFLLLQTTDSIDLCDIEPDKIATPTECTINDLKLQEWLDFSKKQEEEGTALIRGKLDPFDCMTPTEDPFTVVLRRTGTSPFDLFTFYIVAFPVVSGVVVLIATQLCRFDIKQDTTRDKYGFRVKSYPILPVSMMQESDKDKEFKRVKRNTVGWYCHKWFFCTNDIIREIPAEDPPPGPQINPWEKVRFLGRLHTLFRNTSVKKHQSERATPLNLKTMKDDRELEKLFPNVKIERKVEVQRRQPQLKKLWIKLNEWINELPERESKQVKLKEKREKLRKAKGQVDQVPSESSSYGDSDDSYWGSSESYSSDHDRRN